MSYFTFFFFKLNFQFCVCCTLMAYLNLALSILSQVLDLYFNFLK